MSSKIVVGPINKGLRNDVTAFNIDNDNFPQLINAYQWRGRAKRKRGTSTLGRLTREIDTQSIGVTGASPWSFNLYSSLTPPIIPETNASIVPGSVQIFLVPINATGPVNGYTNASDAEVFSPAHGLSTGDEVVISGVTVIPGTGPDTINGGPYNIEALVNSFKLGVDSHSWGTFLAGGIWTHISGTITFIDQGDGTLTSTTPGNSGTIDYLTGNVVLTYTGIAGSAVDATFKYFPNLPVMGLEELSLDSNQYPGTIAFDTVYAYNISSLFPYEIYNVNFYKNPPSGAYPGYVHKTVDTEFTWNGQDYQQFWTENYQNAFWATNGITVPFKISNIGMQYKPIEVVTVLTPTTATLQIIGHGLVQGDFVFINEVQTTTGINFQTGYVTSANPQAANTVDVTFPNATLTTNGTGGIAQYLTNTADATKDCIRWYDGDPTVSDLGWVNFAPPLSQDNYIIGDAPAGKYYLAGARLILAFKDRLLFFGPVIQTSALGSQIYLQDTVIYSQNGTPYYTTSYTNSPSATVDTPTSPTNIFHPILLPINQTSTSPAFFEDSSGFGGFIQAGINQPIITASSNSDVLIVGFERLQARLVYTGNDVVPFNFFTINSELGSSSTFSVINMDAGILTRGNRGFVITAQRGTSRIDLDIPDQVFQISLINNGAERVTAVRDFINEWIYFTYTANQTENKTDRKFPDQTLLYNYRDNSWAIFEESYTTYGQFNKTTGFTWATVGTIYPTWSAWNDPWSAGVNTLEQPDIIAGNQQGFVMVRDDGTDEGASLYIKNIAAGTVTSPSHNLKLGEYIIISECLGTVGAQVNNKIFSVSAPVTVDTFTLTPPISAGTYLGKGLIQKMYVPLIQSRQFPISWEMGRKTRIGVQQYLLSYTAKSQIQLLIFLSQNYDGAYNRGPVLPAPGVTNSSLIYSTVLYTCPESINLGLTPANINLNMVTAEEQEQIWHRINTSLLGDTVQVGFSLSDEQMRSLDTSGSSFAITGITAGASTIIQTTAMIAVGHLIRITGVVGMVELNFVPNDNNNYSVISSTPTTVTINVDSTAFAAYISGGTLVQVSPLNQFAEIELHAFILEVSPSMLLA